MTDPIQHWAMVQQKIRAAQKEAKDKILEEEELDDESLKLLAHHAFLAMQDAEIIETEYGFVQKLVNGRRVDYYPSYSREAQTTKREKLIFVEKKHEPVKKY